MPLTDSLGSLPGKGQKLQGQGNLRKEEKLHVRFLLFLLITANPVSSTNKEFRKTQGSHD